MKYEFVVAGTSVKKNKDAKKLFLDVGNALIFGVIDHHQFEDEQKSATKLVFENPDLIPLDTESIILHNSPDLDCIASSYLANFYIKNQKFPSYALELANFLDKSDFGFSLENRVNLSSLLSIVKSKVQSNEQIVSLGHTLIENMASTGFDVKHIPCLYQKEALLIDRDRRIYSKDKVSSRELECILAKRVDSSEVQLKALILKAPKSKLFKEWAREEGYDLLIVKWSKARTVISLKADSFYTLKGVGDSLNALEKLKRSELDLKIEEENREGYDIPDPWYDGRAHNFTIIDAPMGGTSLSFDEILGCLC